MDMQEIAALFHIHEKAQAHGQTLTHIRDWAYGRLKEENETLAKAKAEPEEEKVPIEEDTTNGAGRTTTTIDRRL